MQELHEKIERHRDAVKRRNALMAKALRETGQDSTQEWNEAVAKVNPGSEQIFGLAELAQIWGWEKEALDLW